MAQRITAAAPNVFVASHRSLVKVARIATYPVAPGPESLKAEAHDFGSGAPSGPAFVEEWIAFVSLRISFERLSSSSFCLSSSFTVCHCWVGDHLTLGVGPVLADHHEGREEDRLERLRRRSHRGGAHLRSDCKAEPSRAARPRFGFTPPEGAWC